MTADSGVRIVGFAGCTSLGYALEPTLAAMGAGLNHFTETEIPNLFGTPVTTGALLDPDLPRIERLPALARIGLAEMQGLLAHVGLAHAPFMVGVPSDLTEEEEAALRHALHASAVVRPAVAWVPAGRASALLALARAADLIRRGSHRAIVFGGIDSLCAPATVQRLVAAERVLGPHTEGTIPGEAAMFGLLVSDSDAIRLPTSVEFDTGAHVRGTPFAELDRVSGDALASVLRALRQERPGRVDSIIAAHSGEGYFGRSFAHAYLREVDMMPEPLDVELIADCVGDVGAAAGVVGLAFSMYRMATNPVGPRGRMLVYSESDTGEVAAAIVMGAPASWQWRTAA